MKDLSKPLANALCPLCGKLNECAPAQTGSFQTPCWCADVSVSAAVLARIPEAMRNQACLCPACASRRA